MSARLALAEASTSSRECPGDMLVPPPAIDYAGCCAPEPQRKRMMDSRVIPLPLAEREDVFETGRRWLTRLLVRYALLDSLERYAAHGQPYPFVAREEVLPHRQRLEAESPYQNSALLFCIDGTLTARLNRHFRLRSSNQVTWGNMRRLAPSLDLTGYRTVQNRLDGQDAEALLRKLLPLDYGLLVERPLVGYGGALGPATLTHLHVKVERLTDNAIRDLARALGYVRRSLFERGADYAEALEAKFFEYYGFPAAASGRKGAAAMATQLLAGAGGRFGVYTVGQQDGRLCVLDDGPYIRQYMLIAPQDDALPQPLGGLSGDGLWHRRLPVPEQRIWLYQVELERTAAAVPASGLRKDLDVAEPWLRIRREFLHGPPGAGLPPLAVAWAADDGG